MTYRVEKERVRMLANTSAQPNFIYVTVDYVNDEKNIIEVHDSEGNEYQIYETHTLNIEKGKIYPMYRNDLSETGYSIVPF